MNRVGAEGRGESVWLGWFLLRDDRRVSRRRASARDDARARRAGASTRRRCAARSSSTAGTANGIGAATSTTARRSARRSNDECQIDSIAQSWSVISGACRRRPRRAGDGRGRRARSIRRDDGLALLFTPPFDHSSSIPATSKAIRRACARTAASTRTRRSGRSSLSRLGDGDAPGELFACSIRSVTRARAPDVRALQGRALCRRGRRLPVAPHIGRGGWTWYTGSAAGCIAQRSNRSSASTCAATRSDVDPCVPATWPGLRDRISTSRRRGPHHALRDRRRQRRRRRARRDARLARRRNAACDGREAGADRARRRRRNAPRSRHARLTSSPLTGDLGTNGPGFVIASLLRARSR